MTTIDDIAARHGRGHQQTVELRQCALFVDSNPIARAMTDAATWIDGALADANYLFDLTSSQAAEITREREKFAAHTAAVSIFLNEMLAILDPCADETATLPVKDVCASLVLHGTAQRQSLMDQQYEITRLTAALADAEARGVEKAVKWHDGREGEYRKLGTQQAERFMLADNSADIKRYEEARDRFRQMANTHQQSAQAIRAIAQSPEDGKQEKV